MFHYFQFMFFRFPQRALIICFLSVAICFVSTNANAMQQVALPSLLKKLEVADSSFSERFYSEKVMPNDTTFSIVILPIEKPDDEVQAVFIDLHLLVVNNQTGELRSKAFYKDIYISDAYMLNSMTIDTAPYRLNAEVRAFGLKAAFTGSSGANPSYSQQLSLFIEKGNQILRVLKDFTVERYNGENNTLIGEGITLEDKKRNTILIMDKGQANGYYDIRTRTKIRETETRKDKQVKDSTYYQTGLLRFNGTQYEMVKN